MVKLRLRRAGRKKRPFYRVVVADSRAPRDGRFIELIGTYNSLPDVPEVDLQEDRVLHWLQKGAQPSATVKNLLQNKGIWLKWTLIKKGADEAKIAEELAKWELTHEEKMKRTALKKEDAKKKKSEEKDEPEEVEETTVSEETESLSAKAETPKVEAEAEIPQADTEAASVEKPAAEETEVKDKSE